MPANKITLFASVIDGKTVRYPAKMTEFILQMKVDRVRITIQPDRRRRTNPQNAYYWGVVIPHVIAGLQDAGNGWLSAKNEQHCQTVHKMLAEKFLDNGTEMILPTGEKFKGDPSTSGLDTMEFSDYVEKIRAWSVEFFNLYIPDPGDLG